MKQDVAMEITIITPDMSERIVQGMSHVLTE